MRILVTGSEGFIGKHVVRVAEARGHDVTGCDAKNDQSIHYFDVAQYDCVIHLAAYIDIKESFDKAWDYIENNLFQIAELSDAKRVVFASSAAVYGEFSPYGYTKRLAEHVLPKESIALRLFNPFGPGEDHANETHVVPLLAKGGAILFNSGIQTRDFIDVRDVAEAFVLCAEARFTGTYDLCNTPLTIKEVADLMGCDYAIDNTPRDEADTLTLVGDCRPLQKKLAWKPKYNVREELKNWRNW